MIAQAGTGRTCTARRFVQERGVRAARLDGHETNEEDTQMPTYIMLTRFTPDGVKTLKDNPARVHEVTKEVEQLGVKVINQWATLGSYDFVSVVEAPDEKTMLKLSVEMGSRGTVQNETLTAIDSQEFTSSL
jgi:uncharacterized protein with GYD domain